MKHFFYLILLGCITRSIPMQAQQYSVADSLKAESYFNQSWKFNMNSEKHQRYLDSALQIIPTYAYYWQQKCMPLYKEHKYELGKPFLDSAVKYNPEHYLEYRGFMECIFSKHYAAAKADYQEAKSRYGNRFMMDHSYDFYIGLCCLQLNQYDSAQHYFDAVIADDIQRFGKDGVHFNHSFYRGIASYVHENYTEAIYYFDQALAKYPQFADVHYYKSNCLYYLHKKEEAREEAQLAFKFSEQHYSLNEDNAIYEYYPYQVRTYYYAALVNSFSNK